MRAIFSAGFILGVTIAMNAGAAPPVISDLALRPNPNEAVPLAAIISFSTDTPTTATLEVSDDENSHTAKPSDEFATQHKHVVLYLRPGRTNTVRVRVKDRDGEETLSEALEFKTDPLPDDFPPIDLKISRPRRMEPGVTLVPFFRWPGPGPDATFGLVVALDAHGEIVWYFRADHTVSDLVRIDNGNFVYQDGRTGLMYEIDILGNYTRRWHTTRVPKDTHADSIGVDTDSFHHDGVQMPNGNFLILSTEVREFEDYPTSENKPDAPTRTSNVIGDIIVEFKQDGTKVREWKNMDLLDPYRIGYGSLGTGFYAETYKDILERPAKDWSHTNSIFYDAKTDSAILSSYHQDVVYKLDLKTGKLVWLMGTHGGWGEEFQDLLLQPTEENFQWNYHQHAAKVTPQGTYLMFDNGTYRARPFDEKVAPADTYSRALEVSVDEKNMTITKVWQYGGPDDEIFFSPFISDVDWLPVKSNILITSGGASRTSEGEVSGSPFGGHHFARIFEVTHDTPAEKVFEIEIDDPATGWAVYRSERMPSLYP